MTKESLRYQKDNLVSALFELTRAADTAARATLDFYNEAVRSGNASKEVVNELASAFSVLADTKLKQTRAIKALQAGNGVVDADDSSSSSSSSTDSSDSDSSSDDSDDDNETFGVETEVEIAGLAVKQAEEAQAAEAAAKKAAEAAQDSTLAEMLNGESGP